MVMFAREQERRALPGEVLLERLRLAVELRGQLRVAGFLDELERGEEVVGTALERAPQLDFRPEAVRLAEYLLGTALVVPETGFAGQRFEFGSPRVLRPEVKDAPRSTGSAPPDPERWTRPLRCGPEDPGAGSDGAR